MTFAKTWHKLALCTLLILALVANVHGGEANGKAGLFGRFFGRSKGPVVSASEGSPKHGDLPPPPPPSLLAFAVTGILLFLIAPIFLSLDFSSTKNEINSGRI
eukprot:766000-Hanusia_phi.AAC.6